MVTPTAAEKSFSHTASSPTKQAPYTLETEGSDFTSAELIAVETASSTIHLVDVADGMHTLCGLHLSRVLTGGYCEHLNGDLDDPLFERTIFARDGQEAEPCEECLSRQPSVLVTSLEDCQ